MGHIRCCPHCVHVCVFLCVSCNLTLSPSLFSAQMAGLLCEEEGPGADNVKYCGYCKHHYNKMVRWSAVTAFLHETVQNEEY